MVKKSFLSAVTAIAVMTTGVMAFDVKENAAGNGIIYDIKSGIEGAYKGGVQSAPELKLSATQKGDALLFPAFRQSIATTDESRKGWETEAVIRNNSDNAVIAKITFHNAGASEEIFDFNIYLSAHDAFRFTIADGHIITKDSSIVTKEGISNPVDGVANDKATMNPDGTPYTINENFQIDSGYFTVVAMAESDRSYHNDHTNLYLDYRKLLDECRPEWRNSYKPGGISNGVIVFNAQNSFGNNSMVNKIESPNVAENCDNPLTKTKGADFFDPRPEVLMGTLRLYNPTNDKRDLIIPATAISNVTDCNTTTYATDNADVTINNCALTNRPDQRADGNMLLYTEAEFSNFNDRTIFDDDADETTTSVYEGLKVRKDAETFLVRYLDYTYENTPLETTAATDKVDNTVLATQIGKRTLIQLGNDDQYWVMTNQSKGLGTYTIGGLERNLWNENERNCNDNSVYTPVSPFGTDDCKIVVTYPNELQAMNNIQDLVGGQDAYFIGDDVKGFAKIALVGAEGKGIPAVMTQMIGTAVGGIAQTNWVFSPVDRPVIAEEKSTYFRGYDFVADDNVVEDQIDELERDDSVEEQFMRDRDVLVTRENLLDNVPAFDKSATVQ